MLFPTAALVDTKTWSREERDRQAAQVLAKRQIQEAAARQRAGSTTSSATASPPASPAITPVRR